MSNHGLTNTGFITKRLDVILEEINTATKDIFGESLNVSPSSPDGQYNGLNALSRADLWELLLTVYLAFDPQSSTGVALSRLVTLNGIFRKPATKSKVTCVFTGNNGTIIPAGFEVKVINSNDIFVTTVANTITNGSIEIPMESKETGTISAEINTITNIISPLNGLVSVTNTLAADVGSDEESDQELRNRQRLSTETPSQNLIDSQYSTLLKLNNVKSVNIYENDTNVTNNLGIPAHSFNVIINGGDNNEIANAIFLNKTPGVGTFGNTNVSIIDKQSLPRTINFSRPVLTPIFITINTTNTGNFPQNGVAEIKQKIIDYALVNFNVGSTIERTRLYTPINSVAGHSVQSLFIGLSANPTGIIDIPILFNALGQFLEANITVNIT